MTPLPTGAITAIIPGAFTPIRDTLGGTVERIDVAALNLPPKGDVIDWIAVLDRQPTTDDVLALPKVSASRMDAMPAEAGNRIITWGASAGPYRQPSHPTPAATANQKTTCEGQ